jgi:hypothetical protein
VPEALVRGLDPTVSRVAARWHTARGRYSPHERKDGARMAANVPPVADEREGLLEPPADRTGGAEP